MVGHFWINLVTKKIHVRMPATPQLPSNKKVQWLAYEMGFSGGRLDAMISRCFDNHRCEYIFSLKKERVDKLIKMGFDTEPWTFNYLYGPLDRSYKKIPLSNDVAYLKVFQEDVVKYGLSKKGRVLYALDPGLGKTVVSLATVNELKDAKPVLIVCPATIKEQWRKEWRRFIGINKEVKVLYGRDSITRYDDVDAVIVNYELLAYHIKEITTNKDGSKSKRKRYAISDDMLNFLETGFKTIIIDECHKIKDVNGKSKSYKAIYNIAKNVDYVIALSGTPIENSPGEIFNIANIISPHAFNNRWYFLNRYAGPEKKHFGLVFKGATLVNELNRKLNAEFMVRRKKAQISFDMPPVQISVIPFKLERHNEYLKYKRELEEEISDPSNKLMAANKYEKLLQKTYDLKYDDMVTFIDDQLEKKEKIIIFAWHRELVQRLHERYKDISVKIDGSTPSDKRQEIKDEFIKNKHKKVFIGNILSAGTGLDGLQKICDTVIFSELTWKSTTIDQAIDRVNRMGFKGSVVFVYYLIGLDTVEETLAELIDKKRRIVDKTMDGKSTDKFDLLEELIKVDKEGMLENR